MDGEVTVMVDLQGRPGPNPNQDILKLPYDFLWEDLVLMLGLTFECEAVRVKYIDDENEAITINSQEELFEAFMVAKRCHDTLHLQVNCISYDEDDGVTFLDTPGGVTIPCGLRGTETTDGSPGTSEVNIYSRTDSGEPRRTECPLPEGPGLAVCPQPDVVAVASQRKTPETEAVSDDPMDRAPQGYRDHYVNLSEEVGRMMRDKAAQMEEEQLVQEGRLIREEGLRLMKQGRGEGERSEVTEMEQDEETSDAEPPAWFKAYMDKFKQEIVEDIARLVSQRTVRSVLRGLEGAVITTVQSTQPRAAEASSTSSASPASDSTVPVYHHFGIICDNCENHIVGVRYKCGNCKDYDLCEACEGIQGVHDPNHVFVKLRRPPLLMKRKKNGELSPLLKRSLYDAEPHAWQEERLHNEAKMQRLEERLLRRQEREEREKRREEEKIKWKEEKWQKKIKKQEEKLKRKTEYKSGNHKRGRLDLPQFRTSLDLYEAKFVGDVTVPDGTSFKPGVRFTKMWALLNSGQVLWEGTKLKMLWGNFGAEKTEVDVPLVPPGEEYVVQVDFVAPDGPGTYQSHWRLCAPSGAWFGHRIWCSIVVVEEREEMSHATDPSIVVLDEQRSPDSQMESEVVDLIQEDETEKSPEEETPMGRSKTPDKDYTFNELMAELTETNQTVATTTFNESPLSPVSELGQAMQRLSTSSSVELLADTSPDNEAPMVSSATSSSLVSERMLALKPAMSVEYSHEYSHESLHSLESIESDTESESDFYIVPLPDCFNTSVPLAASSSTSVVVPREDVQQCLTETEAEAPPTETPGEGREDQTDMVVVEMGSLDSQGSLVSANTPTDSAEASEQPTQTQEVQTDSADEESTEAQTDEPETENAQMQSVDAPQDESTQQAEGTTTNTEQMEQATSEQETQRTEETAAGAQAEAKEASEEKDQTEVKSRDQTPEQGTTGRRSRKSSPTSPTQVASTVLTTALGVASQAAVSAYSTARDVFHTLQAKNQYVPKTSTWTPPSSTWTPPAPTSVSSATTWTPPPSTWTPSSAIWTPEAPPAPRAVTPMEQLVEMGFADRELNRTLLAKHSDDVEKVVGEILQQMDSSWAEHRH